MHAVKAKHVEGAPLPREPNIAKLRHKPQVMLGPLVWFEHSSIQLYWALWIN